jgi:two-component system, cell cycle sensor histidine kinase and response regulator CckA
MYDADSRDEAGSHAESDVRILVVDDNDDVRRVMVRALQRRGFTVLQAAHGGEAVDMVERLEERIDVLVTDIEMPVLKGRETAERIRACLPGLPVLFVSGYTTDDALRDQIRRGEVHFLPKPFDVREFLAMVDELLASRP